MGGGWPAGLCPAVLLTGGYVLGRARAANRETSLFQAVHWAIAAWAAWVAALVVALGWGPDPFLARYFALCLTGCAAVAVLGARRPGVGAWNFVVLGLLAVELLPVAERALTGGEFRLAWFRTLLIGGVIGVGVLNYLPTRLGPAAACLAVGTVADVARLSVAAPPYWLVHLGGLGPWFLAVTPWVGYLGYVGKWQPPSEFDRVWRDFRDRFGLVWGQRLREQFNRAAANAGWPVVLYWQGLFVISGKAVSGPAEQAAILAALRALMKRFVRYGPEQAGIGPGVNDPDDARNGNVAG